MLASRSPRRRELLRRLDIPFATVDPRVNEVPAMRLTPLQLARWAAEAKASAVARRHPRAVVVGADTVVALDGIAYGKPRDGADARRILQALSGRTHLVITAVHVVGLGRTARGYSRTRVRMRRISPDVIRRYVATGEVKDKAGAYAIQGRGARLVQTIEGPYDNVVGLPLRLLTRLLRRCGVAVPRTPHS